MSEQEEFEKLFYTIKGEWANQYPLAWYIWQACAERKDKIIEKQAAELAVLRGFAREAIENLRYGNDSVGTITDYAKEYNLIDENGHPTALLTGEKE